MHTPTPRPTSPQPLTEATLCVQETTVGDIADLYDYVIDEGDWRVTCKFCGKENLHWEETPAGWRLYTENDRPHNCRARPAKVGEFEDLTRA